MSQPKSPSSYLEIWKAVLRVRENSIRVVSVLLAEVVGVSGCEVVRGIVVGTEIEPCGVELSCPVMICKYRVLGYGTYVKPQSLGIGSVRPRIDSGERAMQCIRWCLTNLGSFSDKDRDPKDREDGG